MEENEVKEFDICVVGAGVAGIIFTIEYAKRNPSEKILLIEYGSRGSQKAGDNELDKSIKITNPINHHLPFECTNKGLGGSTATWGGRCVNYDEVDFIDRPIVKGGCTWDLNLFSDVSRYLQTAADYFECGMPQFNTNEIDMFKDKRISDAFIEGDVTDSVLERWSMPTRFGKRYRNELTALNNVQIMEGFEAVALMVNPQSKKISKLLLENAGNGGKEWIKATTFVLSAGTQETTRILLKNIHIFSDKVPDALGKYYQGHLSGKIASVKFYGNPKNTNFGFLRDKDGIYLRRRFQFSTEYLIKKNLLNTAIWLDNPLYFDPKHKSGAMSFMYLAMITPFLGSKLAPPAIAHSVTKGKVFAIKKHIINVIKGLPGSLLDPAAIFYKRYILKRKLPGIFLYNPQNIYALHFHSEQVPDKNNRMELDEDGKTLIIRYQLTDADIDSVIKLHEKLDDWLRKSKCGELVYWFSKKELFDEIRKMSKDGIHQSGTTRIANSPEEGVVDKNLKVWGLDNLYICSSSVFPTSGQANPTFFLGAFAVRLADHLSKKYEKNRDI